MIEFRDDEGRPWRLALTIAAALRVRDNVCIDVDSEQTQPDGSVALVRKTIPFDIVDVATIAQTFQILRSQYAKVGEVLYAILSAQVDAKGITREQFLDSLRGDSLESAIKALESELADFFPQRLRRMVRLISAKMEAVSAEMLDRAEAEMEAATLESLSAQSGIRFGKQRELSEPSPESLPTDNSQPLAMPA